MAKTSKIREAGTTINPVSGDVPFARRVVDWQRKHGRHGLPWQGSGDPYRVWLSEIMLQQTQVSTVLPYFTRFIAEFPTVGDLAAAEEGRVMSLWAGLGYYARARNLLACARQVVARHGGEFPQTVEALAALPGIGLSTAGAVLSLSGKGVAPILDGNVRRVFARCFGIFGHTTLPAVQAQMWALAHDLLPGANDVMSYNQGLMDLGATICVRSRPKCEQCPVQTVCVAKRENMVSVLPTPKPPAVRRTEHHVVLLRLRRHIVNRETVGAGELAAKNVSTEQPSSEHLSEQQPAATSSLAVWLERRPARGIWGGLWMAPMQRCADDQAPPREPDVVHELTHRRYCLYAKVEVLGEMLSEVLSGVPEEVFGEACGEVEVDGPMAASSLEDTELTGRWLELPLPADAPVPAALHRLLASLSLPAPPDGAAG